jgi:TolB-like protein/Tfp pilus assembly protein PilF
VAAFLQRLKQRKLVQWALAYIAAAFALLQGLDIIAQQFGWPDDVRRGITLALIVGFFVVLVLAWYHGERGAQKVSGTELLILALLLAIGGGALWRYAQAPSSVPVSVAAVSTTQVAPVPTAAAVSIPAKSVAVLPWVNESGNKDEQYFSDGLSENLITALSQFAGLKVISRSSSFQFRDTKDDSAIIGRKLGVAHLLEGSVQRIGDEVRINAELVNAADGSTLWSQRYDRPYKDLFKLQDDITAAVANALKTKLLESHGAMAQSDRPPSGNLDAYNAYLQGSFYAQRPSKANLHLAIEFFDQAIHLDARYALAYAERSRAWTQLAVSFLELPSEQHQAFATARDDVSTALTLDPNLAAPHDVHGWLLATTDFDWKGAEAEYRRALQLAPGSEAKLSAILAALGQPQQALDQVQQTLTTNPLCSGCYMSRAVVLMGLGQLDAAAQAMRKALELAPTGYWKYIPLTYIEVQRGHAQAALQTAQQIPPGPWRNVAMAMAQQASGDHVAADAALKTLIDTSASTAAYQVAEVYALRQQPDPMFAWLERARANRDPAIGLLLLNDPPILRYKGDPRFATFCRKVGLPVPGTTPAPIAREASHD